MRARKKIGIAKNPLRFPLSEGREPQFHQ